MSLIQHVFSLYFCGHVYDRHESNGLLENIGLCLFIIIIYFLVKFL